MAQLPEVSEKNKKGEILEAYHEALKELEKQKNVKPAEVKQKKEEEKVLQTASSLSFEGIIKGLADVKLNIGKSLDSLEDELLKHYRQFTDLEKAIQCAKKNLEEVHEITAEADSLSALIQAQKQMKQEFDEEIRQEQEDVQYAIDRKKAEWECEQTESHKKWEADESRKQVERSREEEEYSYQLKTSRQKEQDAYALKKQAQEKELKEQREIVERELAERESRIASKEERYEELEAFYAEYPSKLQRELQKAREETEERVKRELHFEMELAKKEMEGERKLFNQRIEALEAKIKEQEVQAKQLNETAQNAGLQMQKIAVKAIESASSRGTNPYLEFSSTKGKMAHADD